MTTSNRMPPVHPGEILREEMDDRDLSANALARALEVPTNRITAILNGQRGVTADTARRLSRYFGTTPGLWLNLQKTWELRRAEIQAEEGTGGESEDFEAIVLLDVDRGKTCQPDPGKALYNVYFRLSGYPPSGWLELFEAERQVPRHAMWRRAWVEDRYIVVCCVPEEVRKCHLRDIKQDVQACNEKYRQHLQREAMHRAREEETRIEKDSALASALEDLDFD